MCPTSSRTSEVLQFEDVTFSYRGSESRALDSVSFVHGEGGFIAVMGPTGAGKSSLVRCVNRIIPRFFPGEFSGEVRLFGEPVEKKSTSDISRDVGVIFQDFESQLFSTNAVLEVAFGPENLGVHRDEIRGRVGEALSAVGMAGYEERDPTTLSGGEKQRLAIASVLSMQPRLLVLDEPTTDLDPSGKRRVFEIVDELRRRGMTVLLVEHESNYAALADSVLIMRDGKIVTGGPPAEVFSKVELLRENAVRPLDRIVISQHLGIEPLPDQPKAARSALESAGVRFSNGAYEELAAADEKRSQSYGEEALTTAGLWHEYAGGFCALRGVDLCISQGEFVAVLGQNGSGKTTLVKHFNGLLHATRGEVKVNGIPVEEIPSAEMGRRVGYVFQNPDHQVFASAVQDEVAFGPRNMGFSEAEIQEAVSQSLQAVGLEGYEESDPYALTKGERQRIAVASILACKPGVIILDEPTTGLDYLEQAKMMDMVRHLNEQGHTIIIITHSMWVAAEYAHRVVVVREGKVIADGSARAVFAKEEVLAQASLAAPEVTRISKEFGLALLSVEEFLGCVERK